MQAKKSSSQKAKVGKKRSIDNDEVDGSRNGCASYGRIYAIDH
jgi:hypothetical protein